MEICRGEAPWSALGNFMNDWFENAKDRREQLIADPVILPASATIEIRQWAAFCAASAEWLSKKYHVPCPLWVHDPIYTLAEPWFSYPQTQLREWLVQHTPEPFARGNVYCGDRMFDNKYEAAERVHQYVKQRSM